MDVVLHVVVDVVDEHVHVGSYFIRLVSSQNAVARKGVAFNFAPFGHEASDEHVLDWKVGNVL